MSLDSTGCARARMVVRGDSNFTIECWVKSEKDHQNARIFSFAQSDSILAYGFYMHDGVGPSAGNIVTISLLSPSSDPLVNSVTGNGARLVPYRWTHLALVRKGSIWKFYRNGEYIGHWFGQPIGGAFRLLLGLNFVGKIAEFRIWNIARSQDSIRARMYTVVSAADSGLLIYYNMSGGRKPGKSATYLLNRSRLAGVDSLDAAESGNLSVDSSAADQPPFVARYPHVMLVSMPRSMQFFARDEHDSATILIEGFVSGRQFDSVLVEIDRNDTLVKTLRLTLDQKRDSIPFQFKPRIHAELSQFAIRLFVKRGDTSWLVREAADLVCGDAYLICGQSNSHPADTSIRDQSPYLRSFGVQTENSNLNPYNAADTLWGLANGHGYGRRLSGPYLTGVWGYHIQQRLMADEHLPICIINGGAGASTIEENLPNYADPSDLKTIYGRTLYRSQKSGLAQSFRAIFWYQGESNTLKGYYDNFKTLYQRWLTDYSNARRFYVFQVRPSSCGAGTTSALRDLQRTLGDSLPNIRVMSTASAPGHDGCHFKASGYISIGESILPWVEHDFYNGSDTVNATPPMIHSIWFASAARDEIRMTFEGKGSGLHIIGDTLTATTGGSMKDYLYLDSGTASIRSVSVARDTVVLKLSGRSTATHLTYLPEQYFNGINHTYEGPTIVNTRNIGALTFHRFPIQVPPETDSSSGINYRGSELDVFPNPFTSGTRVHVRLEEAKNVELEVLDVLGRTLSTLFKGNLEAGDYSFDWPGSKSGQSSRALFVRLLTNTEVRLVRMVQEEAR